MDREKFGGTAKAGLLVQVWSAGKESCMGRKVENAVCGDQMWPAANVAAEEWGQMKLHGEGVWKSKAEWGLPDHREGLNLTG